MLSETAYRLCETDASLAGNLDAVHACARDGDEQDVVLVVGDGGFRLWDYHNNVSRSFALFSSFLPLPTSQEDDDRHQQPNPLPVKAPVTNVGFVGDGGIVFSLWKHEHVFHCTIPRIHDSDNIDCHWFYKGSRVHQLQTCMSRPTGHVDEDGGVGGQIETLQTHRSSFGGGDCYVAAGSELGELMLWRIDHNDSFEVDFVGRMDVFENPKGAVTSIAFAEHTRTVVVGGVGCRIQILDYEENGSMHKVDSLLTGFKVTTCVSMSSVQGDDGTTREVLTAGFESGMLLAWDYTKFLRCGEESTIVDENGELRQYLVAAVDISSIGIILNVACLQQVLPNVHGEVVNLRWLVVSTDDGSVLLYVFDADHGGWKLVRQQQLPSATSYLGFHMKEFDDLDTQVVACCEQGVQKWTLREFAQETLEELAVLERTGATGPGSTSRHRGTRQRTSSDTHAPGSRFFDGGDDEQATPLPISLAPEPRPHPLGRIPAPVEEESLESEDDEEDRTNGQNPATTCFDGFRDRDLPPLPLSELQEPSLNSSIALQHELERLQGMEYENSNPGPPTKTRDEPARERERENEMFQNLIPIAERGAGDSSNKSTTKAQAKASVRKVPPQVSPGWKYVPLSDRLPDLTRKHANRRRRRDGSDDQQDRDDEANVARGGRKRGGSRVPQSEMDQAHVRSPQEESRLALMTNVSSSPQAKDNRNAARRSYAEMATSLAKVEGNALPWFYRQRAAAAERPCEGGKGSAAAPHGQLVVAGRRTTRDDFYLTTGEDGKVQFHNFHSLS